MKKISVLLFGIGLLGISFYGLLINSYYIQLLMNFSSVFIYARIALVAVLLTYTFVPSLRSYTTRALLSISGFLLLLFGVLSVSSQSILGHSSSYILIGDSLTLTEAGILAIVLSAELSAKRSRFMDRGFIYIRTLFATRPMKLAPSPLLQPAKMLKSQFQLNPVLSRDGVLPIFEGLVNARTVIGKVPS